MSVTDVERFRQLLLEERDRVTAAIDNLHRENPGDERSGELTSYDQHPADVATDTHDREMDQTLAENEQAVLTAINGALARIDDGTFGTCRRCGKPIADERLEALPYAEHCIDCKREVERR